MPWQNYFDEEDNPFAPQPRQTGVTGIDWGFDQPNNPYRQTEDFSDLYSPSRFDRLQPQGRGIRDTTMPTYNMAPMERYNQYLGAEPEKDDYKPGKWGTILNSLSAGVESMDRGLGSGIKLYQQLRDQPYEEEYKKWLGRGNKLKADVDLENTRYRNVSAQASRNVDDARADAGLELQRKNLDLAERKFSDVITERQRKQITEGFTLAPGPTGTAVLWRKNPDSGQLEIEETPLPNARLTAAQQQQNAEAAQTGANTRAGIASRTSIRNTDANIRSREKVAVEREKRLSEAATTKSEPKPVTARAVVDPVSAVTSGYKEFNSPELITMKKDEKGKVQIADYEDDPAKVKAYILRISGGDPERAKTYAKRWLELTRIFDGEP